MVLFSLIPIRAGLIQLIQDRCLRELLIKRGLLNVRRFSSDCIAAQYLRIYQSILSQNAKR